MMPHLDHHAFSSPAPPRHRRGQRFPLAASDPIAVERYAYQLFLQAADESARPARSAKGGACTARSNTPSGHGGTCPERSRGSRAEKSVGRRPATEGVRGKPDRVPPVSASNSGGIPLAYQLWLAHLLWLEEVLHTLDCRPGDVTAAELAGLQALSRARARFLQEHQFCSRCQAANPRFAQRCRRCAHEF
jgi:ribosomal protein L40E